MPKVAYQLKVVDVDWLGTMNALDSTCPIGQKRVVLKAMRPSRFILIRLAVWMIRE
jgi:hypothetical protein